MTRRRAADLMRAASVVSREGRSERGSMSLLVCSGVLLFSLATLAVADVGSFLVARSRAQAAADAAALAAVVQQVPALSTGDPAEAARLQAESNGATLVRCVCSMGAGEATVEVGIEPRVGFLSGWIGRVVRARARAEVDEDVLTYQG